MNAARINEFFERGVLIEFGEFGFNPPLVFLAGFFPRFLNGFEIEKLDTTTGDNVSLILESCVET